MWVPVPSCTYLILTLSQTKNFRLFQTDEFADDNFCFHVHGRKQVEMGRKTLWEKEKLIVTSNFSFSQSVYKRLVLQTHKKQGLFGKG